MTRIETRHRCNDRIDPRTDVSRLLDGEMTVRSMTIQRKHEAFAKAVAQASDGLCCVFSMGRGRLLFAAAKDRAADLNELVDDLEAELESR